MEIDRLSGIFQYKPELINVLIEYIRKSCSNLVSVGSGNGYVEYHIKAKIPENCEIVCIDPDPESFKKFDPVKHIKPKFNYLSECKNSDIKNSTVLLNWPNPDDNGYDIESLIYFEPKMFCISYGPCGSSGSDQLIDLLSDSKIDPLFKLITQPSKSASNVTIGKFNYNLIYCNSLKIGSGFGFSGRTLRLVIYVRDDHMDNFNCDHPVILFNEYRNGLDTDCIIS